MAPQAKKWRRRQKKIEVQPGWCGQQPSSPWYSRGSTMVFFFFFFFFFLKIFRLLLRRNRTLYGSGAPDLESKERTFLCTIKLYCGIFFIFFFFFWCGFLLSRVSVLEVSFFPPLCFSPPCLTTKPMINCVAIFICSLPLAQRDTQPKQQKQKEQGIEGGYSSCPRAVVIFF